MLALDLEQQLTKGDESFRNLKKSVDDYVKEVGLDLPKEREPDLSPTIPKNITVPVSHLHLKDAGICTIVWATGFRYDFDWVKLPILDDAGEPSHRRGVTQFRGIYFLGLRWLYKRKSSFLVGSGPAEDASYLAEQITALG